MELPGASESPPDLVLPPAPEGWAVHSDPKGNFFFITPVIEGRRFKISKSNHLDKLIEQGHLHSSIRDQLIFKKSVFQKGKPGKQKKIINLVHILNLSVLRCY